MEQQQYNQVVFSTNFKSAGRTYFLNMLESKKNTKYIKITESKETGAGEYEKHMIMLFENGVRRLSKALNRAILEMGKPEENPETAENENQAENAEQEQLLLEDNSFPNSGKKWVKEDEEKLEFLFKAGKTVEDLVEIFGRSPGGIEYRLNKLDLIEA